MGKHTNDESPQASKTAAGVEPFGWRIRNRSSVSAFAFLAAAAFLAVAAIAPNPPASAAVEPASSAAVNSQTLVVSAAATGGKSVQGDVVVAMLRDEYTVTAKKIVRAAPIAGVPDPGSAQAIGHELVMARGWGEDQYSCLVSLFNRESHWNVYAGNPVSGAYGIPQALPGSKMASAGADWQSNPRTQITWGLGYIAARYGTPCGAWSHSQSSGWY
ncbi:aggregation-promoting factor C-terminal-like domain-containing protein [Parafrigoribacterium soli]|uniref:aggregation-promoting factor C-terminal-like domain-containing protein n=1 Tax=Parafrigoribacterium soli TaxID=3144663 RepID=UPI0032ED8004